MLSAGINGLSSAGKSTLFRAVTKARKAQAANDPFCTINPDQRTLIVPDPRLEMLSNSKKLVPAATEIVEIAGLVCGGS